MKVSPQTESETTPFFTLQAQTVLQAAESLGFECNGYQLALNSYENRVYQVEIEGGYEGKDSLIAKFYRHARWSDAAILEEHQFTLDLDEAGICVAPPIDVQGGTLHQFEAFRFALYPMKAGRGTRFREHGSPATVGAVYRTYSCPWRFAVI